MSIASDIKTILLLSSNLTDILSGGIYTEDEVGPEGITRDTVEEAFDSDGFLKPSAFIRNRDRLPDGNLRDLEEGLASTVGMVEIWVYQDRDTDKIYSALSLIYGILEGYSVEGYFPLEWAGNYGVFRDEGALKGASTIRQDWSTYSILGEIN